MVEDGVPPPAVKHNLLRWWRAILSTLAGIIVGVFVGFAPVWMGSIGAGILTAVLVTVSVYAIQEIFPVRISIALGDQKFVGRFVSVVDAKQATVEVGCLAFEIMQREDGASPGVATQQVTPPRANAVRQAADTNPTSDTTVTENIVCESCEARSATGMDNIPGIGNQWLCEDCRMAIHVEAAGTPAEGDTVPAAR